MSQQRQPGIYVEILIRAPLERVWTLTQDPGVHQRWDLRFSRIEFLPNENETDPRRFIYETRIGAGLTIRGTGESVATRLAEDGRQTDLHQSSPCVMEAASFLRLARTVESTRPAPMRPLRQWIHSNLRRLSMRLQGLQEYNHNGFLIRPQG